MAKPLKEYLRDYYTIIKEGQTTKDKLVLFLYLLNVPTRMFYRAIKRKYKPVLSSDVTIENQDGIFFCGSSFLVAQGAISTYEPENKKYFNLKKGVFVDIGANIGRYTIIQARKFKEVKVVAIEPEPRNIEILSENVQLNNLRNVILVKKACSDSKGISEFWLGTEGEGTAHSLIEIKNRGKKIFVETDTLDSILKNAGIKKVDLIKVDVEGAEPNVFMGAKNTLKKRPKIIFEALSPEKLEECKNVLSKYNYKIKKISDRDFYAE